MDGRTMNLLEHVGGIQDGEVVEEEWAVEGGTIEEVEKKGQEGIGNE